MFPIFTQCRPIAKLSDIEDCLTSPPEWVNRVIPLKKRCRYVTKNTLSDCHSREDNFFTRSRIDCRTVPKTLVCHDYKGGYLSDSERILAATGISKNTLYRIRKEGKTVSANVATTSFSTPNKKRPERKMQLSPGLVAEIKTIIYDFYSIERRSPTIQGILRKIKDRQLEFTGGRETLRKLIHGIGFRYVPFESVEDNTLSTDGYTFYNWSQIDYFVYFSHYFITIPPLAWVNAGHQNGVKVLGTIITENRDGIQICDEEIFKTKDRMKEFVYKLIEIQKTFGFDGWLLNIENPVQNPDILKEFVNILTKQSHIQDEESVIIWYDSVTNDGLLKWQDELNDLNRCFFDSCDGIFLNYGWDEEKLKNTVASAGLRRFDVFVGIDVFGRNMFGGGQFNTYKAAEMISKYNLSMAIFAPGWTHECMERTSVETTFRTFLNRDDAFWASLRPYLYTHPINDFFETDFHIGLDYNYYNLYIQRQQATRILHPEYTKTIPNYSEITTLTSCDCVKRGFFESRNVSLISSGHLPELSSKFVHNIFTCDISINGKIGVYFLTKRLTSSDSCCLDMTLVTCYKSGSFRKIKLLGEPKHYLSDNMSVLEVNRIKDEDVKYNYFLNEIARKHVRLLSDSKYAGTITLSMFEFSTIHCDLLEIGTSVVNGTSIYLLEFGIVKLS